MDTTTENGRLVRLSQFVKEYAERRNWVAITRLIGGSPRYDLQDYLDADNGEEKVFKNQERDEDVRANEVEIAQELAKTGNY